MWVGDKIYIQCKKMDCLGDGVSLILSLFVAGQLSHSYYKELVRKPGKLQRNKQRSKDLRWKVHDPAQSFVLYSDPLAELRNRHVSIG